MQLATMLNQLLVDAYLYLDLLRVSDDPINAGFEMTDTGETATMIISESISIQSGLIEPAFKLILTEDLLRQALNKEVDLFSLAGRAHINDKRPVDFEFIDRKRMKESMETLYRLATFFTIPGPVKWKKLSLDYAGTAHGARPIPLVYWKDLRTSWYHIPRGSVLNEAGEKDPWPQAFILLKGKGRMILDDSTIALEPSATYYIPRNVLHQVHADEDIELIWIAWDAPMFS